jgi:hypothetical protein
MTGIRINRKLELLHIKESEFFIIFIKNSLYKEETKYTETAISL